MDKRAIESELDMNMRSIKEAVDIETFAAEHLQRAERGHRYVCPFCLSGGHERDSDSAFSVDRRAQRFTCFSCNAHGDVFDLAVGALGIDPDDRPAQLRAVAAWAGIDPADRPAPMTARTAAEKSDQQTRDLVDGRERERAFVLRAQSNIDDPAAVAYLASRGIDRETARAEGLGYDSDGRRVVIPWCGCDWYHVDRAIDPDAKPKYSKPRREDVGEQPLWNAVALDGELLAVCEGPFDALALERVGVPAVALGGTGFSGIVRALAERKQNAPTALLAFDRDEPGRAAQARMADALAAANLPYRCIDWPDGIQGKDADEMDRADHGRLQGFMADLMADLMASRAADRETAYASSFQALRMVDVFQTVNDITCQRDVTERVPTRFPRLDAALDGGLPCGLVVLGAVSSVGKTTFALQVADQLAERGREVLFVTVEQSGRELVAKSLSRLTAFLPGNRGLASTTREIDSAGGRDEWGDAARERYDKAVSHYWRHVAPRMHMLEGTRQPSVGDIKTVAGRITEDRGQAPVVFIDYLQLLASQSERDSDKQATDKNVMALRQMARELQTPVVVISSLNRASYSTGVTLESFKESGAIEYGSDLLLGLQPSHMADELARADERKRQGEAREIMRRHKSETVRQVELVILKNRAGRTPADGLAFQFDAAHNLWTESVRPDGREDFPTE